MSYFIFKIIKKIDGNLARVGEIHTPHGIIHTPAFVVVGTKGTVKALTPEQVRDLGAETVLANTYHLYLEPGDERIKNMGGLNKVMNWQGPTMTDSGGFQVFSLGVAYGKNISKLTKSGVDPELLLPEVNEELAKAKPAQISEEGVSFRSHIDGSAHYFTPKKSIDIQHNLGADIIVAFDECTSPNEPFAYQRQALDRTHRWAKACLKHHLSKSNSKTQALYGVVQGGRFEDLRKESAQALVNMKEKDLDGNIRGFDGFAIGGSFAKEDMATAVAWVNGELPEDKPRHLLGIGEPEDLFMGVENGCDTFDCVAPTRIARNGQHYTKFGKINIKNLEYRDDLKPIDEGCECYTCKNHTRAYVSHLHRSDEMLAATLSSIHNLYFIVNLIKKIRQSLLDDSFQEFKNNFLNMYLKIQ
jgi:queuine tRNA-ribosyltransferase